MVPHPFVGIPAIHVNPGLIAKVALVIPIEEMNARNKSCQRVAHNRNVLRAVPWELYDAASSESIAGVLITILYS